MRKIIPLLCALLSVQAFAHAPAMSPTQKRRAMQMTSYFENSTIKFQYCYIENIHDGRGFTAGRIGFTSATGDLADLVADYCEKTANKAQLCSFQSTLNELAKNHSGNTHALTKKFVRAWKNSCRSPIMRNEQDLAADDWYFEPAMRLAEKTGLQTALGKAIFYDTIIQHGETGDDSLAFLIAETNAEFRKQFDEASWLKLFLQKRKQDLLNPSDPSTQQAWAESVSRVDLLDQLLKAHNYNLDGPIEMDPEHPSSITSVP